MKKLFFLTFFLSASLFSVRADSLKGKELSLSLQNGRLVIANENGTPLLSLGKLKLMWRPPFFAPEELRVIAPDSAEINYKTFHAPSGVVMTLKARCAITAPGRMKLDYTLTAPAGIPLGGSMLEMFPAKNSMKTIRPYKSGLWTRSPKGGVPFEVADGAYRLFQGKTEDLWLKLPGNPQFSNGSAEHIAFRKTDSVSTASVEFLTVPRGSAPAEIAARFQGRPAALTLSTAKEFNLWNAGNPEFKLNVYNTSGKRLSMPLTLTVRDFDGKTILSKQESITLPENGSRTETLTLPPMQRGIYFVEASCRVNGQELFTRTTLAVLPDHHYASPETSRIGMAAFFPIPNEDAVFRLMKRIGVCFLRNNDNSKTLPRYGIVSFAHNNVDPRKDIGVLKKSLDSMLERFQKQKNPAWEFGNEWNMKKSRESKITSAEKYAELFLSLSPEN